MNKNEKKELRRILNNLYSLDFPLDDIAFDLEDMLPESLQRNPLRQTKL